MSASADYLYEHFFYLRGLWETCCVSRLVWHAELGWQEINSKLPYSANIGTSPLLAYLLCSQIAVLLKSIVQRMQKKLHIRVIIENCCLHLYNACWMAPKLRDHVNLSSGSHSTGCFGEGFQWLLNTVEQSLTLLATIHLWLWASGFTQQSMIGQLNNNKSYWVNSSGQVYMNVVIAKLMPVRSQSIPVCEKPCD